MDAISRVTCCCLFRFLILLLLLKSAHAQQTSLYVTDSVYEGISDQARSSRILEVNPLDGSRRVVSGPVMLNPKEICIDSGGSLLVTDEGRSGSSVGADEAVWRLDPQTLDAQILSGMGIGAGPVLSCPGGITVLNNGWIAIVDEGLDAIVTIEPVTGDRSILSDRTHGSGPAFIEPDCLTRDAFGHLIVADGDRILRVDAASGNRSVITSSNVGSGPDAGEYAGIVVEPGGSLVAMDQSYDRLLRIDAYTGNRSILSDNSSSYTGPQFKTSWGLARLVDGSFLVSDQRLQMVIRVLSNGQREAVSGNPESGQIGAGPALIMPRGLLVENDNSVLVVDPFQRGIMRVNMSTAERQMVPSSFLGDGVSMHDISAIARESDQSLIAGDYIGYGKSRLLRIQIATGERTVVSSRMDTPEVGSGPAWENKMEGITIEPSGKILTLHSLDILRVDPASGDRSIVSTSGYPAVGVGPSLVAAGSLLLDRTGAILAFDDNQIFHVNQFNGNRDVVPYANIAPDPSSGCGAVLDSGSTMIMADNGRRAIFTIDVLTGLGQLISGYPPSPNRGTGPQFDQPLDVIIESNDTLFVCDSGFNAVLRVNRATGNREIMSGYDPVTKAMVGIGPYLRNPSNMCTASDRRASNRWKNQVVDLQGQPVTGACTDGETELYIQLTRLPIDIAPSEISFSTLGNGEGTWAGGLELNPANNTARRRYRVPGVFAWEGQDAHRVELNITVRGKIVPCGFYLARPPVVLMHGLWSDAKTWEAMMEDLDQAGYLFVWPHNYRITHGKSFAENRDQARLAVEGAKWAARTRGYICKKVDVVGHSMGGILARYYMEGLSSQPYHHDIRKLITVGTPHSGSQIANLAIAARESTMAHTAAAIAGVDLFAPAITDLAVDSRAIDQVLNAPDHLHRYSIPSHAIIGTLSSVTVPNEKPFRTLVNLLEFTFGSQVSSTVLGQPNDGIVSGLSQQGGLLAQATRQIPVVFHTQETGNDQVIAWTKSLLGKESSSLDFAKAGFIAPLDLHYTAPQAHFDFPSIRSGGGTIEIISPLPNVQVVGGQALIVQAHVTGSINAVFYGCPVASGIDSSAPYEFSFQIPMDYVGPLDIVVLGRDGIGVVAQDSVSIMIVAPAEVTALEVLPGDDLPLYLDWHYPLLVRGIYSDGLTRDVTSALLGTTYNSSDRNVVEITPQGEVIGRALGEASITIEHRGSNIISRKISVRVVEDLNRSAAADWRLYP